MSERDTNRISQLREIGLNWDGQSFIFKDINFHWTDIIIMDDEKFNKTLEGAKKRMNEINSGDKVFTYVEVKTTSDDSVIKRFDVTDKTQREIERIDDGININLNHSEYFTIITNSKTKLEVK